jgi:hypothetical protein
MKSKKNHYTEFLDKILTATREELKNYSPRRILFDADHDVGCYDSPILTEKEDYLSVFFSYLIKHPENKNLQIFFTEIFHDYEHPNLHYTKPKNFPYNRIVEEVIKNPEHKFLGEFLLDQEIFCCLLRDCFELIISHYLENKDPDSYITKILGKFLYDGAYPERNQIIVNFEKSEVLIKACHENPDDKFLGEALVNIINFGCDDYLLLIDCLDEKPGNEFFMRALTKEEDSFAFKYGPPWKKICEKSGTNVSLIKVLISRFNYLAKIKKFESFEFELSYLKQYSKNEALIASLSDILKRYKDTEALIEELKNKDFHIDKKEEKKVWGKVNRFNNKLIAAKAAEEDVPF